MTGCATRPWLLSLSAKRLPVVQATSERVSSVIRLGIKMPRRAQNTVSKTCRRKRSQFENARALAQHATGPASYARLSPNVRRMGWEPGDHLAQPTLYDLTWPGGGMPPSKGPEPCAGPATALESAIPAELSFPFLPSPERAPSVVCLLHGKPFLELPRVSTW